MILNHYKIHGESDATTKWRQVKAMPKAMPEIHHGSSPQLQGATAFRAGGLLDASAVQSWFCFWQNMIYIDILDIDSLWFTQSSLKVTQLLMTQWFIRFIRFIRSSTSTVKIWQKHQQFIGYYAMKSWLRDSQVWTHWARQAAWPKWCPLPCSMPVQGFGFKGRKLKQSWTKFWIKPQTAV